MKEERLVREVCQWLKSQGFQPETEVTLGKRGRKIRVDIFVDRNPLPPLAIEVKSRRTELFEGVGKALFYAAYLPECEVWLAMPSSMCKLANHLTPLLIPFALFDATHKTLVTTIDKHTLEAKVYVCPICGEKIGNIRNKKWLDFHLIKEHGLDSGELFEAIRIYKAYKHDESLRRKIESAMVASETDEYPEKDEAYWSKHLKELKEGEL
jgi:hypothetical protein